MLHLRTLDYVTFEVARQLKEKGYDGTEYNENYITKDCKGKEKWGKELSFTKNSIVQNDILKTFNVPNDCIEKGTILLYDAQTWLRENHNISVEVYYESNGLWSVYLIPIQEKVIKNFGEEFGFSSYEDALNKGISNALKLIYNYGTK